jgi:hypothetical protein
MKLSGHQWYDSLPNQIMMMKSYIKVKDINKQAPASLTGSDWIYEDQVKVLTLLWSYWILFYKLIKVMFLCFGMR